VVCEAQKPPGGLVVVQEWEVCEEKVEEQVQRQVETLLVECCCLRGLEEALAEIWAS